MPDTMPLRILGIDPGFDRLGICVLEKDARTETLVYSACIQTSKQQSFEERLSMIGSQLEKVLKTYAPTELAIEKLFFAKNQTTALQVAEVRGVVLYLSHMHGLTVHEYSPPEIKLAVGGHGRASKEEIFRMVSKILKNTGDSTKKDDELDSIAIALTHSAHRQMKMLALRSR